MLASLCLGPWSRGDAEGDETCVTETKSGVCLGLGRADVIAAEAAEQRNDVMRHRWSWDQAWVEADTS